MIWRQQFNSKENISELHHYYRQKKIELVYFLASYGNKYDAKCLLSNSNVKFINEKLLEVKKTKYGTYPQVKPFLLMVYKISNFVKKAIKMFLQKKLFVKVLMSLIIKFIFMK